MQKRGNGSKVFVTFGKWCLQFFWAGCCAYFLLYSPFYCLKVGLQRQACNHLDITKAGSSHAPAGSRQLWVYEKLTLNAIVKLKVDVRLRLYQGWVPARAKNRPLSGWMLTHEIVESDSEIMVLPRLAAKHRLKRDKCWGVVYLLVKVT